MTDDEFEALCDLALGALGDVAGLDWSVRAGDLEWTCRETVDHLIDGLFSYALQVATGTPSGFVAVGELHAEPDATPHQLVGALGGITVLLVRALRGSPPDVTASDGVLALGLSDWRARAGYELALHTDDVLVGLGRSFDLPADLSRAVLASEALWILDRAAADQQVDPWLALRAGSGRPPNRST